jgi:hypothetical protein
MSERARLLCGKRVCCENATGDDYYVERLGENEVREDIKLRVGQSMIYCRAAMLRSILCFSHDE